MKTYKVEVELTDGAKLDLEIEAVVTYPTPFSSVVDVKAVNDLTRYFDGCPNPDFKKVFTRETRNFIRSEVLKLDMKGEGYEDGESRLRRELVKAGVMRPRSGDLKRHQVERRESKLEFQQPQPPSCLNQGQAK